MAISDERVLVVWSERAGPHGERRPQGHRHLRVLSEAPKSDRQMTGAGQSQGVLWPPHPSLYVQDAPLQPRGLGVLLRVAERRGVHFRRQEAQLVRLHLVRVLRSQRDRELQFD